VEVVFGEVGNPPRMRAAPSAGRATLGARPADLFNPTLRAVQEQLYQSERPRVVDSSRFEQAFGWSATPLPEAIRATVRWFRQEAPAGGLAIGHEDLPGGCDDGPAESSASASTCWWETEGAE
jgi:hypothetical protein